MLPRPVASFGTPQAGVWMPVSYKAAKPTSLPAGLSPPLAEVSGKPYWTVFEIQPEACWLKHDQAARILGFIFNPKFIYI